MPARVVAADPGMSLGDLHCLAERLTAVLLTLEHAIDPTQDLADTLRAEPGDLQLGPLYELLPHAIQMSRRLSVDLAGLDGGRV
jgi:hypothetical protein